MVKIKHHEIYNIFGVLLQIPVLFFSSTLLATFNTSGHAVNSYQRCETSKLDKLAQKLDILKSEVCGDDVEEVFGAVEEIKKQLDIFKQQEPVNAVEFKILSNSLRRSFFSLGLAVAVHKDKSDFRFRFWDSVDFAAKILNWQNWSKEGRCDLFNQMNWAEFKRGILSPGKKVFAVTMGVIAFVSTFDKIAFGFNKLHEVFEPIIPNSINDIIKIIKRQRTTL